MLSYNGTNYHGWQSQDNAVTIQSELAKALSIILSTKIEVTGAGRTDTGVHAREYFAHFNFDSEFNNEENKNIIYRINAILNNDISVSDIFKVNDDVHARFSAISRTYKYYISLNKDPFTKEFSWNVFGKIDVNKMNEAANVLFEYIDFTSFSKLHTDVKTNNCKIMQAEWNVEKSMLIFTIKADRFLRNMVRAIVGTLIDVGKGKISVDEFRKIIENKDRSEAGYSVPAKGLFLEKIEYPKDIFSENNSITQ